MINSEDFAVFIHQIYAVKALAIFMQPIIKVENVSKQYRIGETRQSYSTLRETLVESALNSLNRLRSRHKFTKDRTIWALKDVSFEIQPGEVVGIIGRNGSGKSTLLKILSLISEPTSGFVELYGRFGSLLEVGTGFHPELTGRENIYLNGAVLGMSRFEIKKHFDEIVSFAEIDQFVDTPVKRYSSGMYLRLAFAVAAHLRTEIMLIDEVLAVGDNEFQRKCLGKAGAVAREGRTVLFVSHNLAAVTMLCPRTLWINKGRVESDGETRAVISAYSINTFAGSHHWSRTPQKNDRDSNKLVIINSVLLCQEGTEDTSTINFNKDFTTEIEYEVKPAALDMSIVLRIISDSGTVVFTSSNSDKSNNSIDPTRTSGLYATDRTRTSGLYTSVCRIPGNLLRSGTYTMTVGIRRQGMWLELHEHLLMFNISTLNNPLHPNRQGIITPLLEWNDYRIDHVLKTDKT